MTGRLQAVPEELRAAASDWHGHAARFGAAPITPPTGQLAIHAATGEMTDVVGATTDGLRHRLDGTATGLTNAGNAFQAQDENGSSAMRAVGGSA